MNKAELVSAIAEKAGMSKASAQKALNAFCETVEKTLKTGEKITLVGFGTFSVTQRAAREGINPITKKKIKIAAKKCAKFKPGSDLTL